MPINVRCAGLGRAFISLLVTRRRASTSLPAPLPQDDYYGGPVGLLAFSCFGHSRNKKNGPRASAGGEVRCLLGAGAAAGAEARGKVSAIPGAKSLPLPGSAVWLLCILSPAPSAAQEAALGGRDRGQPRVAAAPGLLQGISGTGLALPPGCGLGGR